MLSRSHEKMRVDEDREHTERLIVLDESHAAHVCGQVINQGRPFDGLLGGFLFAKIENHIFDIIELLVPSAERLDIDRAKIGVALPPEIGNEMAADESASAADDNFLIRAHV
jgi:hypothetical protein